jgi:chromosome segregation ATPase
MESKVSEVEAELGKTRQAQTDLKAELAAITEKLTEMKGGYEQAVRSGADEATLDKMDSEIVKLDRQRVRVAIRLTQCGEQIESLQREREAAHAQEDREKYEVDVMAALVEAAEIEQVTQHLMARAAVHDQRLEKMRKYCEARGIGQIPYRLRHAERRISTIFNANHSVNKDYQKPYPEILLGNIAAVERQMNRPAPSSEPPNGAEAEQQQAAN